MKTGRTDCNIKILILVFYLIYFVLFESANAAVLLWSGESENDLASNSSNWSTGAAPQNGDSVIFDGTSNVNCTWDLDIVLTSFNINQDYAGSVVISSNLTIAESVIWTGGGTDNLASNPENWLGGVVPRNGDNIIFNNTSADDCTWDINVTPALLSISSDYSGTITLNNNLTVAGNLSVSGGMLDLNNKSLDIDGNIFIGPDGILYGTSSTITLAGEWANYGVFNVETSTVRLDGINQTVYGDNTFNNLVKISGISDTLYFETGSTQTISNNLTLQGSGGSLLSLQSTAEGQQWFLNAQGSRKISFTIIKDLNSTNSTGVDVSDSEDAGNNYNLNFGGDQCVCLDYKLLFDRSIGNSLIHYQYFYEYIL